MDTENPSAPPRAQSAARRNPTRSRHAGGVIHENTRHTTRFTVIGNHLTQHRELSLLAIGLACHIQSLPGGTPADIKSLAARFPEGPTRIAAALRELEAHGYLRRERHRTPAGRIVTRTVSCNQPQARRTAHHPEPVPATAPAPDPAPSRSPKPPAPRKKHPLPPVPRPAHPAPALLRQATELLAGLHRHEPRLLLSACDTAHLAPGVAAWLEREAAPAAVRHALTADLPPEGVRRPAALLAHRITAHLLPPPPFRAPAAPPPARYELRNCDGCDRAFRSPEPGARCRDCRTAASGALPDRVLSSTL
ncbi:helix-turn-helix domain-containing protein [Streptomyces sp. NPDC005931]|uniref:helix-turn-helix domain-containing protein n=1 Tax=Streptomyces sp. NPDC005931 TaxID=3364737 RepID=UPI003699ED85